MDFEDTKNTAPQPQPYADEVLCANWNPLVRLLSEPPACAQATAPDTGDIDDLMARLYVSQQA